MWKQKQLSVVRGEVSAYTIWRRSGFLEAWVASVSSPEFGFQALIFMVHIPHRIHCEEKSSVFISVMLLSAEAKVKDAGENASHRFPVVNHGRIYLLWSRNETDSWCMKQTSQLTTAAIILDFGQNKEWISIYHVWMRDPFWTVINKIGPIWAATKSTYHIFKTTNANSLLFHLTIGRSLCSQYRNWVIISPLTRPVHT